LDDIDGFHAHVYYDAATRAEASALRAAIERQTVPSTL